MPSGIYIPHGSVQQLHTPTWRLPSPQPQVWRSKSKVSSYRLILWPYSRSCYYLGPHSISNVADLKIITTITNTTGSTLTLVNDPSSILTTKYPTERYHIIHSSGVKPIFKGVRIKFSPQIAANLGRVTVLQPGQSVTSVTITHHSERRIIW